MRIISSLRLRRNMRQKNSMISERADYDICIIGHWPNTARSVAECRPSLLGTALNPNRFRDDLADSVQLCEQLARYIPFVDKTSSSAQGSDRKSTRLNSS